MFTCGKKELGKIIDKCIRVHGFHITAEVLDSIKAMGYKYSTKGALTVAVADMLVPEGKDDDDPRVREEGRQDRPQVQARLYHRSGALPSDRSRVGKRPPRRLPQSCRPT